MFDDLQSKRERKNRRLYILQKEKDKQKRKKKAKDSLFGRSPKKVLKPQKSSPKSKDKSGSKGAPKSSKRSPKVPSDFDDGQLTTRSR